MDEPGSEGSGSVIQTLAARGDEIVVTAPDGSQIRVQIIRIDPDGRVRTRTTAPKSYRINRNHAG